jgi:hypothetical protein
MNGREILDARLGERTRKLMETTQNGASVRGLQISSPVYFCCLAARQRNTRRR